MKTITYEDFVSFNPCWLIDDEERDEHADQLAGYRAMRDEWSALDILRLDEVDAEDRLWLVLREELIDAPILHEFACRCAERALDRIDKPDARSVAAIEAKRKWLLGEISDDAMDAERDAALDAARDVAWASACDAELTAAMASAQYAARDAARNAAWNAACDAEWDVEREWQIAELMMMLEAFIGNPTLLPEVNHKDENKHNNIVTNLEWCTISYNKRYGNGRTSRSEGMKKVWKERRADDER